ncbi:MULTISPECIES: hypothetical protein [Gordonia]|jgi:hypothetical protein|uniref:Uncharacterized protein n=2 Tax=Gordonia alkanivorans TaxID=84096 RepID=F9VXG8_9ACTN|nr:MULTISPECIES: hypothetical protein [Gordonia]AZZ81559.1 hypothetical protein C5O27_11155 [Gordonia alkanivorans]ETA07409.1 hypothetical protein V525_08615 [Gordonia alkanivorans CGMCC 6845]MDH3007690.1 hypothetical protein [Gordonia alkanivorans]MDH3010792.1 hypothetical protein [Gordonia alkanivorans]MDH3015507.1 hypothetical protein [Gordonia alkanivorans]
MATLLTSDEFEIRLLFSDPVPEVRQFLHEVIAKREPIALDVEGTVHLLNVANARHVVLADQDPDDESLATGDRTTIVTSLVELRQ